jgi:hypothetical protein
MRPGFHVDPFPLVLLAAGAVLLAAAILLR